jgi:D-arabinose 1-dehydrogenase-like Zn-dependent alcohol dehydrogenase
VRVCAAGVTRDELDWPTDRLPAVPSYELSGVVASVGAGVDAVAVGEAVYGLLTPDRDGAAAEFVVAPARVLAPKPRSLGHVECAALPLAGLSAWQGLFDHGQLEAGDRVLVNGALGGVGHLAVQLAAGAAHTWSPRSRPGTSTVRAASGRTRCSSARPTSKARSSRSISSSTPRAGTCSPAPQRCYVRVAGSSTARRRWWRGRRRRES